MNFSLGRCPRETRQNAGRERIEDKKAVRDDHIRFKGGEIPKFNISLRIVALREKQESLGLKVAAFLVSISVLSSELITETRQIELGHPCDASIIFPLPTMDCVPQHFASTLFEFLLDITFALYNFFLYFWFRGEGWGGGGEHGTLLAMRKCGIEN